MKNPAFRPGRPKIILAFQRAGGKVARESFSEHAIVEARDVYEDASEQGNGRLRNRDAASGERTHGRTRRGSRGVAGWE
jgi:hypothetical protein